MILIDNWLRVVSGSNRCVLWEPFETHTLCGHNSELFNVEAGGRCSYHCDLKDDCLLIFVLVGIKLSSSSRLKMLLSYVILLSGCLGGRSGWRTTMPYVSREVFWFCTACVEVSTRLYLWQSVSFGISGRTTNRVRCSPELPGYPRLLFSSDIVVGGCIMHSILCFSFETGGASTQLSICASCIVDVVK
jgi:hypothetical protein